jgi:hypothetical protein
MRTNRKEILRYIREFSNIQKYMGPYLVDKGFYFEGFWVFLWITAEIHDFYAEELQERVFYRHVSAKKGHIWTGTTVHFGDSSWVEVNKKIRDWGEKHGYEFFKYEDCHQPPTCDNSTEKADGSIE